MGGAKVCAAAAAVGEANNETGQASRPVISTDPRGLDQPASASRFRSFAQIVGENNRLDSEWEGLADSTGAAPWGRPEWFRVWQRAFAPEEPLLVYGVREGERLAGIGAFVSRNRRLEAAANVHSPWWGFIAENQAAHDAVTCAALRDAPTSIRLRQVRESTADEAALRECARAQGYRVLNSVIERAPFVTVEGDWADYLHAHVGRHQLKELQRSRRRLTERDALAFEWLAPEPDEVDDLLDEGFLVESSGWKRRTDTAILSNTHSAAFYREVGRWAAANRWLRLGFLRIGGRPAAFEFAVENGGVLSLLKGGYDETFARFGPGVLLLHDLLEHAFQRKIREVDLLGGSDPYKLRWTEATRTRSVMTAFAGSLEGRARFGFCRTELLARAAARRARDRLRPVPSAPRPS
jgi:CelD/BcsL family acetyltransferase involved in cellulose biosynthesis